ncbi:MAG: peptidoglycan DD-metalloendopeptidase family protein [Actinomycetota bacterium]
MNFSPLEQIKTIVSADKTAPTPPTQDAMRKAAMQFEAILLQQLTASLNGTTNEDKDEDSLFGGDGGTDLAKKMFSEQLATTMSQSGGVGLADMIMQKFGAVQTKPVTNNIKSLSNAITAIKEIKQNLAAQKTSQKNVSSLINKSAKLEPLINSSNNSEEAQIISTFDDDIKKDGLDESLKNLMLDGKIQNSTRPRIIPNSPVRQISTVSPATDVLPINSAVKLNYQMPVNGRISSGFGNRFHPIDKKIKFHDGIDIAVPVGTKVVAAADGIVKFAGWKGGYGNVVVISHADGSETTYGHNSQLLVTEGQKVSGGEQISLSGSTGKSTGPHVHFEVRQNGQLVNPLKFLSNVLPINAER